MQEKKTCYRLVRFESKRREHRFNMFVPDVREDKTYTHTRTQERQDRKRLPLLGSINLFSTVHYVFPNHDQVDFFRRRWENVWLTTIARQRIRKTTEEAFNL